MAFAMWHTEKSSPKWYTQTDCGDKLAMSHLEQDDSPLPRLSTFVNVFLSGSTTFLGTASFVFILVVAAAFNIYSSTPIRSMEAAVNPTFWTTFIDIATPIVVFVTLLYVARRWYVSRDKLNQTESYIVLIMLALLTACTVGVVNYAIYVMRPNSFIIQTELHNDILAEFTQDMRQQDKRLTQDVEMWTPIRVALNHMDDQDVRYIHPASIDGREKFPIKMPDSDFDLYIVSGGGLLGAYFLMAHDRRTQYESYIPFDPYVYALWHRGELSDYVTWIENVLNNGTFGLLFHVSDITLPKKIIETSVADWLTVETRSLDFTKQALDKNDARLPSRYFLLDATLSAFDFHQDYFIPVGLIPALVALVYAVMKFMYFGLFVGLLTANASSRKFARS